MHTHENYSGKFINQRWELHNRPHTLAAINWELATLAILFDASDIESYTATSLLIPVEPVFNDPQDMLSAE